MKKLLTAIMIVMILSVSGNAANIDSQIRTQQRSQSDMKKKIQQYNAIEP